MRSPHTHSHTHCHACSSARQNQSTQQITQGRSSDDLSAHYEIMAFAELIVAAVVGALLTLLVEVGLVLLWIRTKPQTPVPMREDFPPPTTAQTPSVGQFL